MIHAAGLLRGERRPGLRSWVVDLGDLYWVDVFGLDAAANNQHLTVGKIHHVGMHARVVKRDQRRRCDL